MLQPELLELTSIERPVPFHEPKRQSAGRLIGAAAAFLVAVFCVAEVTIRALEVFKWHGDRFALQIESDRRVQESEGEIYRPIPGEWPGFRINSLGFRGDEFKAKRPGSIRILALGDSVTFGFLAPVEESWPYLLEKRLKAQTGNDVEVLNLGRVATSSHGTRVDVEKYAPQLQPDALIVSVAWWNDYQIFDLHKNMDERAAVKNRIFAERLRLSKSPLLASRVYREWAYRRDIKELQDAWYSHEDFKKGGGFHEDAIDRVRRVPPQEFVDNIEAMCVAAKKMNVPIYFTIPRIGEPFEKEYGILQYYIRLLENNVPKNGGRLIDSRAALGDVAAKLPYDKIWFPDHVHLHGPGADAVASAAEAALVHDWAEVSHRP